jgi:uncharacterized protein (DUF1697 family)
MEYIALLRGVNVGGNAIIKMSDLKKTAEKCGFTRVRTYIQSGNIIFESTENNLISITAKLENAILNDFKMNVPVVVKSRDQLEKIVSEIPAAWKKGADLRCYIAFVRSPLSARDILPEIEVKEGVDFVNAGEGVLYLSTVLSGITKSRLSKLAAKKAYKDITIRNYNTVEKLLIILKTPGSL